jgi:hypothetical protein
LIHEGDRPVDHNFADRISDTVKAGGYEAITYKSETSFTKTHP